MRLLTLPRPTFFSARTLMYWLFIGIITTGFSARTMAQAAESPEKKAVLDVVQKFFAAMEQHDTALARAITHKDCQLYSVQTSKDTVFTGMRTFASFLQVVGQPNRALVEKIWNPTILVHNQIAIVWAPYDFHLDGKFSHCGVDVFNLIKTNDGWKVTGVQYTVEKDACEALEKTK